MSETYIEETAEAAATVASRLRIDRREFMQFCAATATTLGLSSGAEAAIAKAVEKAKRPSVIWLHFQECTGCSESLLRAEHPTLEKLILDVISLDYHETLMAAAGHQAEAARKSAMKANKGKYILVVEGAIPTKQNGIYCKIGGHTAIDLLKECAADAAAVIAIGSCASWGGMPSTIPSIAGADSSPTGSSGVADVLGKPVVTIPGCPPNPYNFLATAVHFLTFGKLPDIDAARPAEIRLRPHHPRALRAPRPLRRRPLRARVRRRGPPQGLLPLQARLQGPGDLRQLLDHRLRRCRRVELAGGLRPPLHRLLGEGRRLHQADPHDGAAEGHEPPASYPGVVEQQGKSSFASAAALAAIAGAAAGGAAMLAKNLGKQDEAQAPRKGE
jgi:hydrogenase small subunit